MRCELCKMNAELNDTYHGVCRRCFANIIRGESLQSKISIYNAISASDDEITFKFNSYLPLFFDLHDIDEIIEDKLEDMAILNIHDLEKHNLPELEQIIERGKQW